MTNLAPAGIILFVSLDILFYFGTSISECPGENITSKISHWLRGWLTKNTISKVVVLMFVPISLILLILGTAQLIKEQTWEHAVFVALVAYIFCMTFRVADWLNSKLAP